MGGNTKAVEDSDWRMGSIEPVNDTHSSAEPVEQVIVAYEKSGLKILCTCRKGPNGACTIKANFCNSLDVAMTDFKFEASVPKGVQLTMQTATDITLAPRSDSVSQTMLIINPPSREKSLMMRARSIIRAMAKRFRIPCRWRISQRAFKVCSMQMHVVVQWS